MNDIKQKYKTNPSKMFPIRCKSAIYTSQIYISRYQAVSQMDIKQLHITQLHYTNHIILVKENGVIWWCRLTCWCHLSSKKMRMDDNKHKELCEASALEDG